VQTLGLRPKPHKPFEKSLIKNFTKVVFCLASCLTFRFAETPLRWPRQDDGAASGSRAILPRVKPGKHRPVLRDEKKLPELLLGVQGNLSQLSHRQSKKTTARQQLPTKLQQGDTTQPHYRITSGFLQMSFLPNSIRDPQPQLSSAE
jgi:hypothetical protein